MFRKSWIQAAAEESNSRDLRVVRKGCLTLGFKTTDEAVTYNHEVKRLKWPPIHYSDLDMTQMRSRHCPASSGCQDQRWGWFHCCRWSWLHWIQNHLQTFPDNPGSSAGPASGTLWVHKVSLDANLQMVLHILWQQTRKYLLLIFRTSSEFHWVLHNINITRHNDDQDPNTCTFSSTTAPSISLLFKSKSIITSYIMSNVSCPTHEQKCCLDT